MSTSARNLFKLLVTAWVCVVSTATPLQLRAQVQVVQADTHKVSQASTTHVYADARLRSWAAAFEAGRKVELERAVAADLASGSPHPLAALVWIASQEAQGRSPEALVAAAPAVARGLVEREAVIQDLSAAGQPAELLRRFPVHQTAGLSHFARYSLSAAADTMSEPDLALGYRLAHLRADPTSFASAWDVLDQLDNDDRPSTRSAIMAALTAEPVKDTVTARFLHRVLQDRGLHTIDLRTLVKSLWGGQDDRNASAYLAMQDCRLGQYAACLGHRMHAWSLYPFRPPIPVATAYLRAGRRGDAETYLRTWAGRAATGVESRRIEALALVTSLGEVGELGEQRKRLSEALATFGDDLKLRMAMARLEAGSGRPVEAAQHWRVALRLAPLHTDAWLGLLKAHVVADDLDGALDVWQEASAIVKTPTPEMVETWLRVQLARGKHGDVAALGAPFLAKWPHHAGLLKTVADAESKLGRNGAASVLLHRMIETAGPTTESVQELLRIADKRGFAAGDALLKTLQARYPHSQVLSSEEESRLSARHGSDRTAIRQAHAAAVARAPTLQWPHHYLAWEKMLQNDLSGMRAVIEQGLASVPADLPGRRADLIAQRADLALRIQKDAPRVNRATLESVAADLKAAEAAGVSAAWIARRRSDLLALGGDPSGAARELLEFLRLEPDDSEAVQLLQRNEAEVAQARRWQVLDTYVKRQPYSADRLEIALHYHAMWGGSPVVALAYARQLEEQFPAAWRRGRGPQDKRRALEKLGAYQQFYREQYDGASALSNSDRYIGWFDSARRLAQGNSSFLVPEKLDLVNMRATVVGADGIEFERGWHPVSGRLTYVRVGRAEAEARYDDTGTNLLVLTDSGGTDLRLEYDKQGHIVRYVRKGGDELSFVYGPNGKPVQIAIKGVGEVKVSYDADGEIAKVDSTGGAKVAFRITQSFSELSNQLKPFLDARDDFPEMQAVDPRLEALRRQARGANASGADTSRLALIEYLVEHLRDRRGHAREAKELIEDLYETAKSKGPGGRSMALAAVTQWHRLASQLYRHGLTGADWQTWSAMRAWLDEISGDPAVSQASAALLGELARAPLVLQQQARWLPRSYIDNEGSWRRHPLARVFPESVSQGTVPTALLVRRNGDVVVGGRRGLSVLRRGFWEWFGYDKENRRLSQDLPVGVAQPTVLALAEDAAGRLWVGLDDGLLRVDGAYEAGVVRYASAMQGLPMPRVEHLEPLEDGMAIGTGAGLRWFGREGNRSLPPGLQPLASVPIRLLRSAAGSLVLGTEQALMVWGSNALRTVDHQAYADARVLDGYLYVLRNNEVMRQPMPLKAGARFDRVPDFANVQFARTIDGLGVVPLGDGKLALAVLTDLGISIFHDAHFEYKRLPQADRPVAVQRASALAGRTVFATSEGLFDMQAARATIDNRGAVVDLLNAPEHGATFVARGDRLDAVVHQEAGRGARPFASVRATHLAREANGALITNDRNTIVRIVPGSTTVQEVFVARGRDGNGRPTNGGIRSLLVASDGAIWAVSGGSLFRHFGGKTDEFSIFLDEDRFPARSHMISRVHETIDKRIWVVASDEGHLYHQGRPMIGGLLEWNGDRFTRKARADGMPWFITSYTAVGEGQAILGTLAGFASESGERLELLSRRGDASYQALSRRQPMLFQGTRGASLGADSWFFGTAGGIVAWHAGRWIMPDRLNWLMPDQFLSPYGARAVHAVATDAAGRIYAGTDRGLMIYESGGTDFMQFVLSENLPDLAFAELEAGKLRAEASALLSHIRASSKSGELMRAHAQSVAALERARQALRGQPGPAVRSAPNDGAAGTAQPSARQAQAGGADLAAELAQRERAHRTLLASLEKDAYGLYQMLELKPIDLSVWRKRLAPEAVVLQYLPTRERLLIHLASRDRTEVREVKVQSAELLARAQAVSAVLADESAKLRGIRGATLAGKGLLAASVSSRGVAGLQEELRWLYEQLLRPVEQDLTRYEHVYVAPVGALSHLPFGALLRSANGQVLEFAAQRFELGVLPSLYLLDLVLNAGDRSKGSVALFGNPDGTLPGAERETSAIAGILGRAATVKLRDAATPSALRESASGARWLHLATHGKLDSADPTKSYLVLAGGSRFSMIDAMELPLGSTETVVLSACESGVGASGLEYGTLSRAFAHAGATSVVASLWMVNDDATEALMTRFYEHRKSGRNVFQALAHAQRDMLARGGPAAHPAAWSAFLAFGRP